jgi:hypothetical protein
MMRIVPRLRGADAWLAGADFLGLAVGDLTGAVGGAGGVRISRIRTIRRVADGPPLTCWCEQNFSTNFRPAQ